MVLISSPPAKTAGKRDRSRAKVFCLRKVLKIKSNFISLESSNEELHTDTFCDKKRPSFHGHFVNRKSGTGDGIRNMFLISSLQLFRVPNSITSSRNGWENESFTLSNLWALPQVRNFTLALEQKL